MSDLRAIVPHVWGTFLCLVSLGFAIWIGVGWVTFLVFGFLVVAVVGGIWIAYMRGEIDTLRRMK